MIRIIAKIVVAWICWHAFRRRHEPHQDSFWSYWMETYEVEMPLIATMGRQVQEAANFSTQQDWVKNAKWKNESKVEVLSGPSPSPFGFNAVKLHYDEIGQMDPEVLELAQLEELVPEKWTPK